MGSGFSRQSYHVDDTSNPGRRMEVGGDDSKLLDVGFFYGPSDKQDIRVEVSSEGSSLESNSPDLKGKRFFTEDMPRAINSYGNWGPSSNIPDANGPDLLLSNSKSVRVWKPKQARPNRSDSGKAQFLSGLTHGKAGPTNRSDPLLNKSYLYASTGEGDSIQNCSGSNQGEGVIKSRGILSRQNNSRLLPTST